MGLRVLSACLLAVLSCSPARALGAADEIERWYILEMQGARAGYLVERTQTLEDGRVRSSSEVRMSISRGPARIDIAMTGESVETADGRVLTMRSEQRLGAMGSVTEITIDGDDATLVESAAGREVRRETLPAPDAQGPAAATEELRREIARGAGTIEITALDPAMGLTPITVRYTRGDRENITALGRTTPATRWTVAQSVMPGVESVEYLDDEAALVRGVLNLGGISITTIAADRELALAEQEPAELLVSTLVKPDRPIENARGSTRGVYLLSVAEGQMPEIPETPAQRVKVTDSGRTVRVEVRAAATSNGKAFEVADAERAECLSPSAMIDSGNPRVRELAAGVMIPDGAAPAEVAEALRAFVASYITEKSLDVGFASASEVAQTREGDCTEHAVLLAALLRARDIPARVGTGVVYVDEFAGEREVFGFHMWTQALLPSEDGGERWVDLDAALDPRSPFDATHITLATSSLGGHTRHNALAAMAPLIGRLQIRVEAVE